MREGEEEGAHTLGYGSMLISQETHDKVECFFEKLFDFEQRVESRCRSKRSSKTRYIYHNLCEFVCAAAAFRDWEMGKGVGGSGIETRAGIGLTAPRLCTCA